MPAQIDRRFRLDYTVVWCGFRVDLAVVANQRDDKKFLVNVVAIHPDAPGAVVPDSGFAGLPSSLKGRVLLKVKELAGLYFITPRKDWKAVYVTDDEQIVATRD